MVRASEVSGICLICVGVLSAMGSFSTPGVESCVLGHFNNFSFLSSTFFSPRSLSPVMFRFYLGIKVMVQQNCAYLAFINYLTNTLLENVMKLIPIKRKSEYATFFILFSSFRKL